MECPKCQYENPGAAKFCSECGCNLRFSPNTSLRALSFEEKLEKIQRYLPQGLTEKILNEKDKIEGERKQVTIMFCDMEGFTALVERIGPEEAYYVMDQVYEILIHTVHEFEGIVNEMTGDGIMAIFGAPIALEDAPQKALWSALAIHREIAKFSTENIDLGPLRMRIGIHTGYVIVGTLGNNLRVDFKAVGNTVNLASRMEKLAEARSTFVTEDTFKLTEGLFQFEAVGKKAIKGKKKTISVYKVLSAKEDVYRPRLGSERMIYSDMVGRNTELDRLELQVMKAINGAGSIVNIIGEAGIGKSRLVAELKKRDMMKRVTIFEGRAISIGRNLSFHPIIDLLKQWARIRADDGEAMAFGKLEAAVRNLYPQNTDQVLPFVATLMGMKPSGRYAERIKGIEGEALEKLIFKNVRELLIRATDLTPLVIILEDLHWADTSSLELIEYLFRLAETRRILFVNVFRPGYEKTVKRTLDTIKEKLPVYYVEIFLEPLNDQISEKLINSMLNISGLHHTVIEQIVQRTGGNPFFIEEVLRSFIDEGVFIQTNGRFEVTEKINSITVPYTIHDVLMARIDRLENGTRNLVKIASVIGRNFFYRILSEVATSVKDINGKLSYLKDIQLFRERQRMGEVEYIFNHALAQEVAYESILPSKCKEMHLKVARSIENVFSDRLYEFFGMLAYHYSRAENLAKAEEYLIKAGEEALKSSASNEALHYYQEALNLYLNKYGNSADAEKIAVLDKNIALALYNRGQFDEAVEYFDKALNYYWGKFPTNAIAATRMYLSAFMHLLLALYLPALKFRKIPTEQDSEVVDLFYKKCEALSIINPKRFVVESLCIIKEVTYLELKKFELGLKVFVGASALFSFSGISFRLSRKILEAARDKVSKENAKLFLIYELMHTVQNYFEGNWKAINCYDEELLSQNLNMGELYATSHHLFWHGLPNIYQGSHPIAESLVQRLNSIYENYENDVSMVLKQSLNTTLLMERRSLTDAMHEIEKGIEFGQKTNQGLFLVHMLACKARIHVIMGNKEEAGKALSQADKIIREVDSVPWQLSNFRKSKLAYDLFCLNTFIGNGNTSAASDCRKQAHKSCRMLLKQSRKVAQDRTEAYRLKGLYYWLTNRQKKALKWWHKSIKEGQRLGARLDLSRTYFEIGKRLGEGGSRYSKLNGIAAKEYLQRARVLFEEMNLQWDMDELDRVSGR
jgi:class 3 adenylate cyclase/tetratricopeptide (TPR) repeat protein